MALEQVVRGNQWHDKDRQGGAEGHQETHGDLKMRDDKIEVYPLIGRDLETFLISHGCHRVVRGRAS